MRREFDLPEGDREHLDARGRPWHTLGKTGQRWLVIEGFAVPAATSAARRQSRCSSNRRIQTRKSTWPISIRLWSLSAAGASQPCQHKKSTAERFSAGRDIVPKGTAGGLRSIALRRIFSKWRNGSERRSRSND